MSKVLKHVGEWPMPCAIRINSCIYVAIDYHGYKALLPRSWHSPATLIQLMSTDVNFTWPPRLSSSNAFFKCSANLPARWHTLFKKIETFHRNPCRVCTSTHLPKWMFKSGVSCPWVHVTSSSCNNDRKGIIRLPPLSKTLGASRWGWRMGT